MNVYEDPNFKIKSKKVNGSFVYNHFIAHIGKTVIETFDFNNVDELTAYVAEKYPNYSVCWRCHKVIRNENVKKAYVGSTEEQYDLCGFCYDHYTYTCAVCGRVEYKSTADGVLMSDTRNYYCDHCIDGINYYYCENCDRNFEEEENFNTDADCCWDCYYECHEEDDDEYGLIGYYHRMKDNGDYIYHRDESGATPMLGFELEVDRGHDRDGAAEAINEILNDVEEMVCFEHDGSLGYSGFEIISQPACIGYHDSLRDKYENAFRTLLSNSYPDNCEGAGLHIHIDRGFLNSDEACAKLFAIFKKFDHELKLFSRRSDDAIYSWARMPAQDLAYEAAKCSRYQAVNFCNRSTVEIRLMASTLNIHTFFASLKLISNLAVIAKNKTLAEIANMSWSDAMGGDEEIINYWNTLERH